MGGPPPLESQASPAPPPPPMWMPMQTQTPTMTSRMDPWPLVAFFGKLIGFALLFVGTLVSVIGGTTPASCVTSPGSCGTGTAGNIINAVLAAKILWTIGLAGIGGGAGVKLHWGLKAPTSGQTDDANWLANERRTNALLMLVAVVLLFILLLSM